MDKCSVADCTRASVAKGYCERHYRNHLRTGSPLGATRRAERGASTRHPLYKTWSGMWRRCTDEGTYSYRNYGARGIKVCERWRDFWQFSEDMGERPSAKHSIDRINNDGNYEPDNCRWATQREQSRNRRTCRLSDDDRALIERLIVDGWSRRRISIEHDLNYEAVLNFSSGFTYQADTKDFSVEHPQRRVSELELAFRAPLVDDKCSVDGCSRKHYAHNYCKRHYRQNRESTSLSGVIEKFVERECTGCGKTLSVQDRPDRLFCSVACKTRTYRAEGRLTFRGVCPYPSCKKEVHGGGLCASHYQSYNYAVSGGAEPSDTVEGRISVVQAFKPKPRNCRTCKAQFVPNKNRSAEFCSPRCYHRNYRLARKVAQEEAG